MDHELRFLGKQAHDINAKNGWDVLYPDHFPGNQQYTGEEDGGAVARINRSNTFHLCTHLALVHSEVSEALEAVRKKDFPNFSEELADIVIRVTSVAYELGIDLDAEVQQKLQRNANRGHRHGGKAV